jgi:dienelactone hydrolase
MLLTSGCAAPANHARPAADRSATPSDSPSTTPLRLPVGRPDSYRIARLTLSMSYRLRDQERRPLRVFVRYPEVPATDVGRLGRGNFPLIVFAPGYRQCASSYDVLLRHWASAGYVVAALQFPLTSCHAAVPDENDLVHQPHDVSVVTSRLLARSARQSGPLAGLINPAEIGIAGHSDGGDTVAAVADNTCCMDRRVRAVVVLAGAEWPPLPRRYGARRPPPILFVQGSADTWNLPSVSIQLYRADRTGIRYPLDLPGADHFQSLRSERPTRADCGQGDP